MLEKDPQGLCLGGALTFTMNSFLSYPPRLIFARVYAIITATRKLSGMGGNEMKKTNSYAVVTCILGGVASICTPVFMVMLGIIAVAGMLTPYTLFVSVVLWIYLAFVGFTLVCLIVTAIGVLIFTVIKRRTPNRVFLGLSIAAAALNLVALLFMTIPLIISSFSPEDGAMLIFAIIAPVVACIADMVEIGFAIAALRREGQLLREETVVAQFDPNEAHPV